MSCKISSLFTKMLFKLKVNKNAHSKQILLPFVISDLFLMERHHQDNFVIFQSGLLLQPYTKPCVLLEIMHLSGVPLSTTLALGSLLFRHWQMFFLISLAMCYDLGNHSALLVMETSLVQRGTVQGAVGRSTHLPHLARVGNEARMTVQGCSFH